MGLENRFADKVAVVTGAGSGIGAATTALFAAEGARVVGLDLRPPAEDRSAVTFRRCDVTDAAQVDEAITAIADAEGRIDVVANVAGIPQFGPIDDLTVEEWQRVLDVNLTGTFLVCRAAVAHLRTTKGCIVNVASIGGLEGQAYTAAYCAAKGGVVLLTKALAVELAPDEVRVSCVCPGGVDTPLALAVAERIPPDADPRLLDRLHGLLPGLIDPADVAEAIAYLASPAARMISGTALVIDGGRQS